MIANDNNGSIPRLIWPRLDSVYNIITRRIRAANTMFGQNVKLVLRQNGEDWWSRLPLPYLLVIPTQVGRLQRSDPDSMSFIKPRSVTMVAQFDARGSEAEYLAANDIDTAEYALVKLLCNWCPLENFLITQYGGMRMQATRETDVKVNYYFTFPEEVHLPHDPIVVPGDVGLEPVALDGIHIHLADPACAACAPEPAFGSAPNITVDGGGCPPEPPGPDPCAPPCQPENALPNGDAR